MKRNPSLPSKNATTVPREIDPGYFKPLQVEISYSMNFDRAAKNFRSLVQSDGILALHKEKSSYEKKSDKVRRKQSESIQRAFEEEMKMKKILSGEYDKEKQKKQAKKDQKIKQKMELKAKE